MKAFFPPSSKAPTILHRDTGKCAQAFFQLFLLSPYPLFLALVRIGHDIDQAKPGRKLVMRANRKTQLNCG